MSATLDPSLCTVPLYRVAQARSGDKSDVSDITVFLTSRELFEFTGEQLSAENVAAFLAPLVRGAVQRYEIPKLFAYKFVCHEALGGGGSSSLRGDNLGKSMASAFLRMTVSVPDELFQSSPLRHGPQKDA